MKRPLESERLINCYPIKTSKRIQTLGRLLNNFYQTEDNSKFRNSQHYFFYLSNDEGMSILEIDQENKSFRIASFNDFDGQHPIPRTHLAFLEGILYRFKRDFTAS